MSQTLYISQIKSTPLGDLWAATLDKGICFLHFAHEKSESDLDNFSQQIDTVISLQSHGLIYQLEQELQEYFDGKRQQFDVPLQTYGTAFQKSVWTQLQQIPYGTTISYKQQSISLANPLAIRAIASANGRNKITILVPCHRVIGTNGKLTGYNGGLWRKKWLLDLEAKIKFGIIDLFT